METEKIIKREDGSRVRIVTSFTCEYRRNEFRYLSMVQRCGKGKRKWVTDYDAATKDEIISAQLELWETIKPKDS